MPSEKISTPVIPADVYRVHKKSSEEAFGQIGLAAFFDTNDDASIDWEGYFGLK
jgi:hypothetical protein